MTPELFELICERIANGEHLKQIVGKGRAKPGMPNRRTFQRYIKANPGAREAYELAREAQAWHTEDEIAAIIEDVHAGRTEPDAARVAMQGLMWLAKVRDPAHYGDKQEIKHGGEVGVAHIIGRLEEGMKRAGRAPVTLLGDNVGKPPHGD